MTFIPLGIGVEVFAVAALLTGRITYSTMAGLFGVACVFFGIGSLLTGSDTWAAINAALAALYFHQWWHGGGGGRTRRRLRDLRARFQGTRRTAPAPV
ncbi:hypothetical protein ACH41H_25235 [Streptomyces sp. NPDC020800]|uniref:hypothetical protein n=1 Tax=Streptomyces sp. NPDC020800 TaxID=3365092 RepID=UPI0037B26FDD